MRIFLIGFVAALSMSGYNAIAADAPTSQPVTPIPAVLLPQVTPPAPATPAPPPPQPIIATLNDGSKVEFDADGTVWVLGPDGSKTPAPDGTLSLKDGTPFVVSGGKRVNEDN